MKSLQPEMLGSIEYKGGRVSEISLRQQNSNVEWLLQDQYELNPLGEIIRLLRRILYLSEDELKEESYQIVGGNATMVAGSAWNPKTNERLPLPRPMDAYANWQIFTETKDLPFASLLDAVTKSGLRAGELCVP